MEDIVLEAHRTRGNDRVSEHNEAAFCDEPFHHVRELDSRSLLEQLNPANRKGASYPFMQFVLRRVRFGK